jgi:hypothetical protein
MTIINNAGNINPILPQAVSGDLTTAKTKDAQAVAVNTQAVPGDKVEISRLAADISKAVIAMNGIQDTRTQQIEKAVQDRVIDNKAVPAILLAQKMLFEDLK